MEDKKLIIRPVKYSGDTMVTSLRLPKELIAAVDAVANNTGRTRNELLITFIEYALDHLEIEETKYDAPQGVSKSGI